MARKQKSKSSARTEKRETEILNDKFRKILKQFLLFREKNVKIKLGEVIPNKLVEYKFKLDREHWKNWANRWNKKNHSITADIMAFSKAIDDYTIKEAKEIWMLYAEYLLKDKHNVTQSYKSDLEQLFNDTGLTARRAVNIILKKIEQEKTNPSENRNSDTGIKSDA